MNVPFTSNFKFYFVDTDTTSIWIFILVLATYTYFILIYSIHAYIAMTLSLYIHELGHYIAAKKYNIYIESVDLTIFNGSTLMDEINNPKENIIVSLSGPIFGFLSLIIIYPYLDLFLNLDYKVFVVCLCVVIGNGLNLIPIKESDGYYILKSIREILF